MNTAKDIQQQVRYISRHTEQMKTKDNRVLVSYRLPRKLVKALEKEKMVTGISMTKLIEKGLGMLLSQKRAA